MFKNFASVCVLSVLFCSSAHAVDWKVYKFAEFGLTGTDNFQNTEEQELVGSIKPSVELAFSGNRFEGDIVAEVELFHFNDQEDEIVDPRISMSITGSIIEGLAFFDGSVDFAKVLPEEDVFDLFNQFDEVNPKTRVRITPFIARSFGRFADFYLGYGFQSISDEDFESRQNTASFTLAKDPSNGGLLWGLGGNIEVDDSAEEKFETGSVYASLGHTLSQTSFFTVLAGREVTDFDDSVDIDDDELLWETSLTWTPSERTALKVGYRSQSFGEGLLLDLEHEVRNSTFSASFGRSISTSALALGALTTFSGSADTQIPITNIGLVNENGVSVNIAPFVEERFQVGYKLAGRRSDIVFDAAYADRQLFNGSATSEEFLARFAFDRHLSPLTTFRLQFDAEYEEDVTGIDSTEYRLGFRFIYNFDRKERRNTDDDS